MNSSLVNERMNARRGSAAARAQAGPKAEAASHSTVDRAKVALGERDPVWWNDGAPDDNRHMMRNTPFTDWFASFD